MEYRVFMDLANWNVFGFSILTYEFVKYKENITDIQTGPWLKNTSIDKDNLTIDCIKTVYVLQFTRWNLQIAKQFEIYFYYRNSRV